MADESSEESSEARPPDVPPPPEPPAAATTEALRAAPQAVKRSMPMGLSIALGILLAGLIGWLARYLVWLVLMLYLSFVIATILDAPVRWLGRLKLKRGPAAVIVMVGGAAIVLTLMVILTNGFYGQISAVSANLAQAPERINTFVNDLKKHFPIFEKMGQFDVAAEVPKILPTLSTLWSNAMWGVEMVSWLVIMFFVVLYMLVDGPGHLRALRTLLPRHTRLHSTQLFNEIAKAHRGWALASIANVTSSSILNGLGLYFNGIPGAFLLGFIIGLGELIPNIGPIVAALPAIAFTAIALPAKLPQVIATFIVVQTIQSWTITPQVMKFSIKLPVLVTILSVLVFGILFGVVGVLAAIPIVADMVVAWTFANRYLEKDTTDYDVVNPPAEANRAAAPAGAVGGGLPIPARVKRGARFRALFRRSREPARR